MFRRENIIGILLLALCAVVACIMIVSISTGQQITVPSSLRVPVTIIGIAAMIIVIWQRFSGRFRK